MSPHSQADVLIGQWNRPYSPETAVFPAVSVYHSIIIILYK